MELSDWHIRLDKHFEQLRKDRSRIVLDRPIFALEHGLNIAETRDLSLAIREHIKREAPFSEHKLPWIVYASELGYDYAGDEYWQTFEENTPGWTDHGNRYWIRECFKWFHKKYIGAKPSGRWAEHFSIICWPITHAVLPRDLQRQLARILYDLRHSFSAELFESPDKLGQLIATRSWNTTSRFQNFTEETQLIGQIAAALLIQGEYGTSDLLFPATLRRISEDLDSERRGREWLRSARQFAKERKHIRGPGLSTGHGPRQERVRYEALSLGIEPRLILTPADVQRSSWDVTIELPDLTNLLFRFPNLRDVLAGTRCVVAGSSGRPLARGRCLYGTQKIKIIQWPKSDEVLLQFEQRDPQLEALLRTDCLLRPGPIWLFRIASDGLAYEMRGLNVRPGGRYIIVSTNEKDQCGLAQPIKLTCEGVHGFLIELPPVLSEEWEDQLLDLGISYVKLIEVWPAGLAAVVWDGEGYGEWRASEHPCLAMRSDHALDALVVSMGNSGEKSLGLTNITPGEESFIELPQLPVGLHTLHVSTRQSASDELEPVGELDIVMRIREARPWSPSISANGPLIVQIEPSAPSLEQLWEGRVDVALQGPNGRQVKCTVRLSEKDKERVALSCELPPLSLPITPTGWRSHFERYFRKLKKAENSYDEARVCELEFKADELGSFSIQCEREFTPLRWAVRRSGKNYIAQLLDDSGNTTPPSVSYYQFEAPKLEQVLDVKLEYKVPSSGGLYVAKRGDFVTSMIFPPEIHRLADFDFVPPMEDHERSPEAVLHLLRLSMLWDHAKSSGNLLSPMRKRQIMLAITRKIFLVLGGENWQRAELSVGNGEDGLLRLNNEIARRRTEADLSVTLYRDYLVLASVTCRERVQKLATLATKFLSLRPCPSVRISSNPNVIRRRPDCSPEDTHWLCELSLRLASDPANAEAWAGQNIRAGVVRLLGIPTLARAARFLTIAIDCHLRKNATIGQLYAGWEWT